jgi:WD40 repeat protein
MASFTKKWRTWTAAALSFLLAATLLRAFFFPSPKSPLGTGLDRLLEGHQFPVQALAFASDGTTLLSAASSLGSPRGEVEVIVWNTATGRAGPAHVEALGELLSFAFTSDGRTLATAGRDRKVRLWDTDPWRERVQLSGNSAQVSALTFSGNGRQLATVDQEKIVILWNTANGQVKNQIKGHVEFLESLAFAPGATILAGGCPDGKVRWWDVATGLEKPVLAGHALSVGALAFSPDAQLLATGDVAGTVKLWDVAERTERVSLATWEDSGLKEEVTTVLFSPDGRTLAVAVGRTVQLWDVATGRLAIGFKGHEAKVKCLAFSPDGTRLASGSYDKTVRLWDTYRHP